MSTRTDTTETSGFGAAAGAQPKLVLFNVTGRRDLAQRAAAAAPGVHLVPRRSWTDDPGEPRRPLLGRRGPSVGLWFWSGAEDEFIARARAILLRFVHPLVARDLPYCLGFPFGPEVLAPRGLGFAEVAHLDLEDIGRLLDVSPPGSSPAATPPPGSAPAAASSPGAAPGPPSPDGVRLDAAQRAAVEHLRGPARVLAPAGSGKTKTLVSRVAELVERGVDPAGILLLAFNRKAAEQLEERLAAMGIATTRRLGSPAPDNGQRPGPGARGSRASGRRASGRRASGRRTAGRREDAGASGAPAGARPAPDRPPGVHCATFNAFGYRYQREVLEARFTLDLDGSALRALMKRAMAAAGVSLAELRPARGSDPVGAFLGGLTRVRAALEPPETVEILVESIGDTPLIQVPFAPAHEQFTRLQATAGCQSFDDQIYLAVADMLADPAHRAFIEARFDHVLVDEFQDLNGAQLALVDVLSRPGRDLFVVGDDDQLIYGWRHADPRGILEFHERMPPQPWSATYTLCTNYRCSRAVVESGARLVANNLVREAKDIRPRPGAHEGAVRFAGAPSWPERAGVICGFLHEEKSRLACEWRDLAVLCRYRSQQIVVALALDAHEVPRSPLLGYRLFTHPAAALLRAYIDLVLAPDAVPAAAVALLLNRPNRYLSNAFVEAAGKASRPWAHLRERAAGEPAAGPRPLSTLVGQVERLGAELRGAALTGRAGGAALTAEQLVWAVVDEFGLEDHWEAESTPSPPAAPPAAGAPASAPSPPGATASTPSAPCAPASAAPGGERDAAGPLQVLDTIALLAETYPDPAEYLAAWDRLRADEEAHEGMTDDTLAREEAEEDRVVIGTIHAAKGREYHAVVIPDYDCDVSRWEKAEIEEERRVVYVGVTRARDTALFTVDTSQPYVHPFLRELVEAPGPEEHAALRAKLVDAGTEAGPPLGTGADAGAAADAEAEAGRRRAAERLAEIEVLFPGLVPEPAPDPVVDPVVDPAPDLVPDLRPGLKPGQGPPAPAG